MDRVTPSNVEGGKEETEWGTGEPAGLVAEGRGHFWLMAFMVCTKSEEGTCRWFEERVDSVV